MSLLGPITLGAAVTTTLQITFCPQFIGFAIGTVPTSIKISVLGDGVTFDLPALGITQMNLWKQLGTNTNAFVFAIADGLISGKNVEITIINADAAGFNLFGWSKEKGTSYLTYQQQTILANSGANIDDFAGFAIAAPGATDIFNVTYQSGVTEQMDRDQLQFDLQYDQNNQGVFLVDNLDGVIKLLNVIPAAQRTAFLAKWQLAQGVLDNAPLG